LQNKTRSTFLTNTKPQWAKQNHTGINLDILIHTLTYAITLENAASALALHEFTSSMTLLTQKLGDWYLERKKGCQTEKPMQTPHLKGTDTTG